MQQYHVDPIWDISFHPACCLWQSLCWVKWRMASIPLAGVDQWDIFWCLFNTGIMLTHYFVMKPSWGDLLRAQTEIQGPSTLCFSSTRWKYLEKLNFYGKYESDLGYLEWHQIWLLSACWGVGGILSSSLLSPLSSHLTWSGLHTFLSHQPTELRAELNRAFIRFQISDSVKWSRGSLYDADMTLNISALAWSRLWIQTISFRL